MTNFLRGLVALTILLAPTQMLAQARYTPAKTPWGHPDISGDYTNKDEANTPLERPDEFKGRDPRSFTQAELDELIKKRQTQAAAIAGGIGGAETGAGPTHWYEHLRGTGNRPWLITDPADGKLPPMTPQALKHEAAVAALNDARNGEGRADSWLDRSTYDRCITRGLPGSMMPAIYGNAYQIMQTPDSVVIRYEMIHETRVIPLDGRPHVSKAIRGYLGTRAATGRATRSSSRPPTSPTAPTSATTTATTASRSRSPSASRRWRPAACSGRSRSTTPRYGRGPSHLRCR